MKSFHQWTGVVMGVIIGVVTWQFSQSNSVHEVHAWLVKGLLQSAWSRTQATGRQVKPWPWADTWPLARLSVPRLNLERIILARASETVAAFALEHLESTVLPGEVGNSVLSIHQDSETNFLKDLHPGDTLELESLSNGHWRYRVAGVYKVDKRTTSIVEPSLKRRLTLVGYVSPQESKNNNVRYVVIAEEEAQLVSLP